MSQFSGRPSNIVPASVMSPFNQSNQQQWGQTFAGQNQLRNQATPALLSALNAGPSAIGNNFSAAFGALPPPTEFNFTPLPTAEEVWGGLTPNIANTMARDETLMRTDNQSRDVRQNQSNMNRGWLTAMDAMINSGGTAQAQRLGQEAGFSLAGQQGQYGLQRAGVETDRNNLLLQQALGRMQIGTQLSSQANDRFGTAASALTSMVQPGQGGSQGYVGYGPAAQRILGGRNPFDRNRNFGFA